MGLVALLEEKPDRAKEVFARLTGGEHAATQDPLVLAWSHYYLGKIYEREEQLDRAKAEYQAASGVQGAPAQVQAQAQKRLEDLNTKKPAERP